MIPAGRDSEVSVASVAARRPEETAIPAASTTTTTTSAPWFRASSFKLPLSVPLDRPIVRDDANSETQSRLLTRDHAAPRANRSRSPESRRQRRRRSRSASRDDEKSGRKRDKRKKVKKVSKKKDKKSSKRSRREHHGTGGHSLGASNEPGSPTSSSSWSSDWEDGEEEEIPLGEAGRLALSLVPSRSQALTLSRGVPGGGGVKVINLPNGDIMTVPVQGDDDPTYTPAATLYSMDRRGDLALAELGSAYRLDIPLYDIVLQDRNWGSNDFAPPYFLRWDELAIRNQVLPSGLVPAVRPTAHSEGEGGGPARPARYFSAGPVSAQLRSLVLPRYRFHVRASDDPRRSSRQTAGRDAINTPRSSMTSSFVPLAPDDLLATMSATEANGCVTSDSVFYQARYADLSREFGSRLRSSTAAGGAGAAGDDVSAWLQMCALQPVLAELQELGSGNATKLSRRGVLFDGYNDGNRSYLSLFARKLNSVGLSVSSQKIVDDRKCAILQEAIKYFQELKEETSEAICFLELVKLHQSVQGSLESLEARQAMDGLQRASAAARTPWVGPMVQAAVVTTNFVSFTISKLRSHYGEMGRSIRQDVDNKIAAENLLVTALAGSATSSIQSWLSISDYSSLVAFSQLCRLESEAGHLERVISLVQALIDLNLELLPFSALRHGLGVISEYSARGRVAEAEFLAAVDKMVRYWDSEAPRIGDLRRFVADQSESYTIERDQETCCDVLSVLFREPDLGGAPSLMPTGAVAWIMQGEPQDGFVSMNGLCFSEGKVALSSRDTEAVADTESDQAEIPLSETYAKENSDFAASFLNAWIAEQGTMVSSEDASDANNSEVHVKENEDDNDDEYEYSAMHSYRIKKIRVTDSSAEYKKILSDMKGFEEDAGAFSSSKTKSIKISPNRQFPDTAEVKNNRFTKYCMSEEKMARQFYPLRIQCDGLQDDVSRQPERVVFGDDIRPHLFAVSTSPSSLSSLVVVCLGALGLQLPSCYRLSSSSPTPLPLFRLDPMKSYGRMCTSLLDFLDDRLGENPLLREIVLLFSTGNAAFNCPGGVRWALLDREILISHIAAVKANSDQYVVDCVVSDIPLSKEGPLLQKFRSNCLWIIQRNEAAITDPQDSTKLSSNVLVLDTYCLCESTLAFLSQLQVNSIEEAQTNGSLKLFEKTLKAVVAVTLATQPHPRSQSLASQPAVAALPHKPSRFGAAPAIVEWATKTLLESSGFASLLWHFVESNITSLPMLRSERKMTLFSAIHALTLVSEVVCIGRFVSLKDIAKRDRAAPVDPKVSLQELMKLLPELIQTRLSALCATIVADRKKDESSEIPDRDTASDDVRAFEMSAASELCLGLASALSSNATSTYGLPHIVRLHAWGLLVVRLHDALTTHCSAPIEPLETVAQDALSSLDGVVSAITAAMHDARRPLLRKNAPSFATSIYNLEALLLEIMQDRVNLLLFVDQLSDQISVQVGCGKTRSCASALSRCIEEGLRFFPNDTFLLSALLRHSLRIAPINALSAEHLSPESAASVSLSFGRPWIARSEWCGLVTMLRRAREPGVWSPQCSGRLKNMTERIVAGYNFFCGIQGGEILDLTMMEVVADVHRAVAASVQKCLLRVNAEEAEASSHNCSVYNWDREDFDRVCGSIERVLGTTSSAERSSTSAGHFASARVCAELWCVYIDLMLARGAYAEARRLLYRAVRHCPGSKSIWLRALLPPMQLVMSEKELMDIAAVMEEKGIMMRGYSLDR